MLKLTYLQSPQQKQDRFSQFDLDNHLWLVSDLKSKLELQHRLFADRDVLPEKGLLRASEFWLSVFRQNFPEFRLVSGSSLKFIAAHWLTAQKVSWAHSPGAQKTMMSYFDQLFPVVTHSDGAELLGEWFQEHPEAFVKWGGWAELCFQFWAYLKQRQLICSKWAVGYLASQVDALTLGDQPWVVDLGADLTALEAQLIKDCSQHVDIEVLVPSPDWVGHYGLTLQAYQLLTDKEDPPGQGLPEVPGDYLRFSSRLSEVKHVVAQVRKHLDKGCAPDRLAIVAPDIEVYWPVLSSYFEIEGVPVSKPVLLKGNSFPEFQKLQSRLRLRMNQLSYSDLSTDYFQSYQEQRMSFDQFARLFRQVYDRDHLQRSSDIEKLYQTQWSDQPVLLDEFLALVFKEISRVDMTDRLFQFLAHFHQQSPDRDELPLSLWMAYFEEVAAGLESTVTPGVFPGVHIENLRSTEWLDVDYLYVLGLAEKDLRQAGRTAISRKDLASLQSLGFYLAHEDQRQLEFELNWSMAGGSKSVQYYFSESDFSGTELGASKFWLLGRSKTQGDVESLQIADSCRWDLIQTQAFDEAIVSLPQPSQQALKIDIGIEARPSLELPKMPRLSSTQLENYAQCPFVFAANKLFQLSDLPDVDLDLDAMTRGQLIHGLFETLLKRQDLFQLSDEQILDIIDQENNRLQVMIGDRVIWERRRHHYLEMVKRFLAAEKLWRQEYPESKPFHLELDLDLFWNQKNGTLTTTETPYPLRGRIDRVDLVSKDQVAVIDYKSSVSGAANPSQWVKGSKYQMFLYAEGFEALYPELDVVAAHFYIVKTMTRQRGFTFDDVSEAHLPKPSRGMKLNRSDAEQLFNELRQQIQQTVQKVEAGEFPAEPADLRDCPKCAWRFHCRAQHLG